MEIFKNLYTIIYEIVGTAWLPKNKVKDGMR